jgi:hypothetical protein
MLTSRSYRRSALKLIARVRLLGKRSAPALSSFATLATLAVLIVGAWIVIAFTRVGLAGAIEAPPVPVSAPRSDVQTAPLAGQGLAQPTVLSKRDAIVYVVNGDSVYYHCPVHAMHDSQRQAVALSVAKSRGLTPCPVCFRPASR